jgi:glycosyltransferase involved in cell wall biosynthesis
MSAETTSSPVPQPDTSATSRRSTRRLRILHLILVLGETNSQYNEHCLPQMEQRDLAICTYFPPKLAPPPGIALYPGNGTLRGFFRALREALTEREYDAVHAHSPHTAVLLPLRLLSRPRFWRLWRSMVLTVHDSFYDYKPRNQAMTLVGLALFERVVFCSHAALESLPPAARRLTGARARVVQNAADLERVAAVVDGVRPWDDELFRVVSVGRLEQVKDPSTMLAAFAAAADSGCRLQLIGAGALEDTLAQEITSRGLGWQVRTTGLVPRDDVFRAYAHADLFVSVSHGEGLPVAVMEAMAAGLPVILSDIPPHREVADGLDVVPLVPPGDVAGFAREITRIRALPAEERLEIGKACRAWVLERFTLQGMHEGYDHVYRELIDPAELPCSSS